MKLGKLQTEWLEFVRDTPECLILNRSDPIRSVHSDLLVTTSTQNHQLNPLGSWIYILDQYELLNLPFYWNPWREGNYYMVLNHNYYGIQTKDEKSAYIHRHPFSTSYTRMFKDDVDVANFCNHVIKQPSHFFRTSI